MLIYDISSVSTKYYDILIEADIIRDFLSNNPDLGLTDQQRRILNLSSFYQLGIILMDIFFILIQNIAIYIMFTWGFINIKSLDEKSPSFTSICKFWWKSWIRPFQMGKKSLLLLGYLLLLSTVVPFGILLFFYPGFFILYHRIFAVNLIFDETDTKHILREAKELTNPNSTTLMIILMNVLIIPIIVGFLIQFSLLPRIFNLTDYFDLIITPTVNYGRLWGYHFLYFFIINSLTLFFPIIYHISYDYVKKEKDNEESTQLFKDFDAKNALVNRDNIDKEELWVDITQKNYKCPKCENSIPLAIKYCSNCGKKFEIYYNP